MVRESYSFSFSRFRRARAVKGISRIAADRIAEPQPLFSASVSAGDPSVVPSSAGTSVAGVVTGSSVVGSVGVSVLSSVGDSVSGSTAGISSWRLNK